MSDINRSSWPLALSSAVAYAESVHQSSSSDSTDCSPDVESIKALWHELTVGYDNMNADEVLRVLLPAGVEVPSSFEQIGLLYILMV